MEEKTIVTYKGKIYSRVSETETITRTVVTHFISDDGEKLERTVVSKDGVSSSSEEIIKTSR